MESKGSLKSNPVRTLSFWGVSQPNGLRRRALLQTFVAVHELGLTGRTAEVVEFAVDAGGLALAGDRVVALDALGGEVDVAGLWVPRRVDEQLHVVLLDGVLTDGVGEQGLHVALPEVGLADDVRVCGDEDVLDAVERRKRRPDRIDAP